MVFSKYPLPPYIVESTIPLSNLNEKSVSEWLYIRDSGVFNGHCLDIKDLVQSLSFQKSCNKKPDRNPFFLENISRFFLSPSWKNEKIGCFCFPNISF